MQTTIRRRSKKRAKQEREYKEVREMYLNMRPWCEVKGCHCEATEIHHMKGRIGELLTNTLWFMAVCRSHHNYIENHPIEAKEQGYSYSRLSKPETL